MMKRQASRRTALAGLLILWAAPAGMATTIVDFEEWAGGHAVGHTFSSQGFVLDCSALMWIGPDRSDSSRNGTVTLLTKDTLDITLAREDGMPFNLLAIDLGEGTLEAPCTQVVLVGYQQSGGLVSATVTLDGILPTFQTVQIERFEDVVRVNMHCDRRAGFSIDNIIVPEPTSASLLLTGLIPVCVWRSCRKVLNVPLLRFSWRR